MMAVEERATCSRNERVPKDLEPPDPGECLVSGEREGPRARKRDGGLRACAKGATIDQMKDRVNE